MTKVKVKDRYGSNTVEIRELEIGDFFRWNDRIFVVVDSHRPWGRDYRETLELGPDMATGMSFDLSTRVEHLPEVTICIE